MRFFHQFYGLVNLQRKLFSGGLHTKAFIVLIRQNISITKLYWICDKINTLLCSWLSHEISVLKILFHTKIFFGFQRVL